MISITPIKQKTGYTCGPTSIAMLAEFYKVKVSWRAIMHAAHCDRNGMSNEEFVQALRRLGFAVSAQYRSTWTDLQKNYQKRLPTVIAWMLHGYIGHFSIVVEVRKNHIVLADPDTGKHRKMQKDVFMRLWFDYDDVFFPTKKRNIHLRWAVTILGIRH